jgi:hypothetical protein
MVLGFTFLAVVFGASAVVAWSRRRREEPLRKEMSARPVVTFRTRVDVKANIVGVMVDARGPLYLIVRGDAFEVSHPFPLARSLFGQEYCYRAEHTTVKVVRGLLYEWIEIEGRAITRAARIWIRRRKLNRQIWDALISAGAHPIGLSPSL